MKTKDISAYGTVFSLVFTPVGNVLEDAAKTDYKTFFQNNNAQHELVQKSTSSPLEGILGVGNAYGQQVTKANVTDLKKMVDQLDPFYTQELSRSKKYDQLIEEFEAPINKILSYGVDTINNTLTKAQRYSLASNMNNVGNALSNTKRVDEAISMYITALEIDDGPMRHRNLGIAYGKKGRQAMKDKNFEEAEDYYLKKLSEGEIYLKMDPNGEKAEGVKRALRLIKDKILPSIRDKR